MAPRRHAQTAGGSSATGPEHGERSGGPASARRLPTPDAARPRATPEAPSSPAALRALQRSAGNRAVARLLGPRAGTTPAHPAVQRAFTAVDAEGVVYDQIKDLVFETRLAFSDHLDAIEASDPDDFNGVYGNYLENGGVFESYLTRFFNAGGNFGQFNLASARDVVEIYHHLKDLVMVDIGGEAGADEAPLDPAFTPGTLVFCSMDGGAVGSIYFNTGRIRLVHGSQPEISTHANLVRYTISNADYLAYWKGPPKLNRNTVLNLGSVQVAAPGQGERLVEFYQGGRHPSRGAPAAFNYRLTQRQINIIYRAALQRNNGVLRNAMAADRLLSQIPLAAG